MVDYAREKYNWEFESAKRTELHKFAVVSDNVFRQLYLRITETKPHKVRIVAVMHKMLVIAHSLVKNNEK